MSMQFNRIIDISIPGISAETTVLSLSDRKTGRILWTKLRKLDVEIVPAGYGTVYGDGLYKYGEVATVTATPATYCWFKGWYENDTLLTTDSSYSTTIYGNVKLKASFEKTYTSGSWRFDNITVAWYNTGLDKWVYEG